MKTQICKIPAIKSSNKCILIEIIIKQERSIWDANITIEAATVHIDGA